MWTMIFYHLAATALRQTTVPSSLLMPSSHSCSSHTTLLGVLLMASLPLISWSLHKLDLVWGLRNPFPHESLSLLNFSPFRVLFYHCFFQIAFPDPPSKLCNFYGLHTSLYFPNCCDNTIYHNTWYKCLLTHDTDEKYSW